MNVPPTRNFGGPTDVEGDDDTDEADPGEEVKEDDDIEEGRRDCIGVGFLITLLSSSSFSMISIRSGISVSFPNLWNNEVLGTEEEADEDEEFEEACRDCIGEVVFLISSP